MIVFTIVSRDSVRRPAAGLISPFAAIGILFGADLRHGPPTTALLAPPPRFPAGRLELSSSLCKYQVFNKVPLGAKTVLSDTAEYALRIMITLTETIFASHETP